MNQNNRQEYIVQTQDGPSARVVVTPSRTGSRAGWVAVAPVDPFTHVVRITPVKWVTDIGYELGKSL